MNTLEIWQRNNDDHLSKALQWLRLRLQHQAQVMAEDKPVVKPAMKIGGSYELFMARATPQEKASRDAITEAERAMLDAEAAVPSPALVQLTQRLGLSRIEQQILLLCTAVELDTRMARLCAQAQDHLQNPYPTFALAFSLFEEPSWDVLSPERPLRYWRLLNIHQPGVQPLTTSALQADERIVNYIKGLNYLDDRLTSWLVSPETGVSYLPPSYEATVTAIVQYLQAFLYEPSSPIIQLLGTDSISKQLIAQQVATRLGLILYRLPVELLPTQAAELETFVRLWERESLLMPLVLYLDAHEVEQASPFYRFLSRCRSLVFLSSREVQTDLGRSTFTVDVSKPTSLEQRELWKIALDRDTELPLQLSNQFNLNPLQIEQIARTVQPLNLTPEQLWSACLTHTRPQLDRLAQRLDAKATWNSLVLPEEETALLHQIAAQVRQRNIVYQDWGFEERMNRGLGIGALFAGESGTGKTMAAEVIANELSLNLYRIDLSAVVSKYIGETEKNLRKLFDAAEDGGAILLFDEADALFGKRSEVKDSHDRYANIEINYLLQRMEAFRGLAILATNMRNALDHAFVRRLRFIVTFPFPGVVERLKMWQKAFPSTTPLENLDWVRLSRLNITGGNIHNIALNAAFLAAQHRTPITMPLVLQAARSEFRKLDRPINENDFKWTEPAGVTK